MLTMLSSFAGGSLHLLWLKCGIAIVPSTNYSHVSIVNAAIYCCSSTCHTKDPSETVNSLLEILSSDKALEYL